MKYIIYIYIIYVYILDVVLEKERCTRINQMKEPNIKYMYFEREKEREREKKNYNEETNVNW